MHYVLVVSLFLFSYSCAIRKSYPSADLTYEIPKKFCNPTGERYGAAAIAISGGFAYITNADTKRGVTVCHVEGKILQNCSNTANGALSAQLGIAVIDNKAIITNMCHNTVSTCNVVGSGLKNCTPYSDSHFDNPYLFKLYDGKTYIVNHSRGEISTAISICDNNFGQLNRCTVSSSHFHSPYDIAISEENTAFVVDNESRVRGCDVKDKTIENCQISLQGVAPTEKTVQKLPAKQMSTTQSEYPMDLLI